VPAALRGWFVFHFVADWVFAVPLFFVPEQFLLALGWTSVDSVAARIVAAALFGIGTQSLLERNAGLERFESMLSLKVIWSATASAGLLWEAATDGPPMTWALAAIFLGFNTLWVYWLLRVRRLKRLWA